MDKKVVYLSGQIDGLNYAECKSAFEDASNKVIEILTERGCTDIEIINPEQMPKIQSCWEDYIIRDLILLKECNVIAMLPNWKNSYGARIERLFAEKKNIEIIDL